MPLQTVLRHSQARRHSVRDLPPEQRRTWAPLSFCQAFVLNRRIRREGVCTGRRGYASERVVQARRTPRDDRHDALGGAGRSMALSRMIPLPESRVVLSAPPARFKSGRGRRRPAPSRAISPNSRGLRPKVTGDSSGAGPWVQQCNFRLTLTLTHALSSPSIGRAKVWRPQNRPFAGTDRRRGCGWRRGSCPNARHRRSLRRHSSPSTCRLEVARHISYRCVQRHCGSRGP